MPLALQQAIEEGTLTEEQLRELITLEAKALGLTFEEPSSAREIAPCLQLLSLP